jgi:hypothetical protein
MHDTALAAAAPVIPVPAPAVRGRETLVRAGAALWRVVGRGGTVIGHLRVVEHPLGTRYRAERLQAATARFLVVGEFWSADEAVASLRV